ncbi:hypothetical protein Barb7_00029 [Bacteroidales bacterium Barb7]|nr:hypothetical protein Barb7_00074 [Bacteroidales bacterium Barb7]OAV76315.1 hypothetical protein Barb7_00029 [Bacteroidales bacterium Barb7]
MKQLKTAVKYIAIACALTGCSPKDTGSLYIAIVNKSSKEISVQEILKGKITPEDTIFQCRMFAFPIPADSTFLLQSFEANRGWGWKMDFKSIPYIQFLIMDSEVYNQYRNEPCDTIRKYVPVLHRYQLTYDDLERMNWTVVYPPGDWSSSRFEGGDDCFRLAR